MTLGARLLSPRPHRGHVAAAPASDPGLSEIWELAKRAPASAGTQPLRVLYVRAHWLEGAGLLTAGQAVKDKNFSLSIKVLG